MSVEWRAGDRGFHSLVEKALKNERARPRSHKRTVAGIKKKRAIKDRLPDFTDLRTLPASR